jgi:hypothetical protein
MYYATLDNQSSPARTPPSSPARTPPSSPPSSPTKSPIPLEIINLKRRAHDVLERHRNSSPESKSPKSKSPKTPERNSPRSSDDEYVDNLLQRIGTITPDKPRKKISLDEENRQLVEQHKQLYGFVPEEKPKEKSIIDTLNLVSHLISQEKLQSIRHHKGRKYDFNNLTGSALDVVREVPLRSFANKGKPHEKISKIVVEMPRTVSGLLKEQGIDRNHPQLRNYVFK